MARLLWDHEGQVIKDYPFPKGSVTIGRRKENPTVITNPEVSSSLARIDKLGPDYLLTDLQSIDGTYVNGLNFQPKFIGLRLQAYQLASNLSLFSL
jgi:pSer/pThr/pTyr-binding forkhead associated (FHA) protein